MILTFLGADHEVTGSCHYLQVGDKKAIVDCGMEQGKDIYVNQELPVAAGDIDYIFLTHAHIDHSGLNSAYGEREALRDRYLQRKQLANYVT